MNTEMAGLLRRELVMQGSMNLDLFKGDMDGCRKEGTHAKQIRKMRMSMKAGHMTSLAKLPNFLPPLPLAEWPCLKKWSFCPTV